MPPPRVPPKGVERVVTFENGIQQNGGAEQPGEVVSTKTVTTGNRTIETVTVGHQWKLVILIVQFIQYKKEKDGLVETRVEHRITIHSNEDIDHEAVSRKRRLTPQFTIKNRVLFGTGLFRGRAV